MKKFATMAISTVLVGAMALGGSLAYLQDTDADVNVMTLGNVEIVQNEQERDGNNLVDFTQGKPAYPAVGPIDWASTGVTVNGKEYKVFTGELKNVVDKIVTVKNTGKSDAYVRTIIAMEAPEYDSKNLIHVNENLEDLEKTTHWASVDIDGAQYVYSVYTYKDALAPNTVSAPSLLQLFLDSKATNEDCAKFGDTWDVLVLSQAVQTAGFNDAATALNTAFGEANDANVATWFGGMSNVVTVDSVAGLQNALNNAQNGTTIILSADITGDVTATQKEDVKVTINGNGHKMAGDIVVDGKSARYETTGLTIENVKFESDSNTANDAFINLGKSGDNNTRYTNNVTVSDCTFTYTGSGNKVAVKSYTGGDKNLTITGCTVASGMHSLVQVKNVETGLKITDCVVESKNGANLNNTPSLEMSGCIFNVTGYAVRVGETGAVNTDEKYFTITDSRLESDCAETDDAVIIFRDNATNATLTLDNTTINGDPQYMGNTADTNIIVK